EMPVALVFLRLEWRRAKKRNFLVQHRLVAGRLHIISGNEWQPEQIIRTTGSDAAPGRRVPPVQNISPFELVPCRLKDVLARQIRARIHVPHRILQLVPETIGPARLVESGTSPETAGQRLVQQPAIQQDVHGWIWRVYLGLLQDVVPEPVQLLSCPLYMLNVLEVVDQSFCLFMVCTLPE